MPDESKPYVIVVGIDYGDASEHALDKALELAAERPRAEVHVLNVVPLDPRATAPGAAHPRGDGSPNMSTTAETPPDDGFEDEPASVRPGLANGRPRPATMLPGPLAPEAPATPMNAA